MKYSYSWLAKLAKLPGDVTPSQLAERLTRQVAEVDGVVAADAGLDCVVAGRITEVAPHPQADRLGVATVDVGSKSELTIVYGNVLPLAAGDVVPVAVGPCTLPTGITVRAGDIRGVRSAGMVCVDEELGLDLGGQPLDDPKHPGAVIHLSKLPVGTAPGTSLGEALGRNDSTLELSSVAITTRPDLWGHVGMAREIAALWGTSLALPKVTALVTGKGQPLVVELKTAKCRRYVAALVENIKVGPSPTWLVSRLAACGVRSINNVVDATNYVMLELGQPLHAFDATKVAGSRIVVRESTEEKFTTLDGQVRSVPKGAVLICDAGSPIALAGIMGGQGSQIKPETTSLIIESANFDPAAIRRAVSGVGHRTDASARFEKNLDPELTMQAMQRVLSILAMKDMCPGCTVVAPLTDVGEYREHSVVSISCSLSFLVDRLGTVVTAADVAAALKPLGFSLKREAKGTLTVTVPSWRAGGDVKLPEDIVEEVGRRLGYDRIKPQLPSRSMASPATKYITRLGRQIKLILAGQLGFSEANTYSFALPSPLGVPGGLVVANPPTANLSTLRQSIVPNLVSVVSQNVRQQPKLALFEYGRVFRSGAGSYDMAPGSSQALPPQPRSLGLTLIDPQLDRTTAFRRLKGAIQELLRLTGYTPVWTTLNQPPAYAPWLNVTEAAELTVGGEVIGYVALALDHLMAQAKIRHPLVVAELDISRLSKLLPTPLVSQTIPKFPGIVEDISMLVPATVRWAEVKALVASFHPLIVDVDLFDVFENKKVGEGLRSLAFHITFSSAERTLTADEVQQILTQLKQSLVEKFKAEIR